MEARIQQKIDEHLRNFKNEMRDWFTANGANIVLSNGTNGTNSFLQHMYDRETMQLQKDDFQRRKRVKNHVPVNERCTAKRANGEQCTRRMLEGLVFCGTHSKGAPHGIVDQSETDTHQTTEKVEIWMQDIQGISYYIDQKNNVYSPEDIVSNKSNPRVIGQWVSSVDEFGATKYSITLCN